jgi:rod shape-determining protein MreC
MEMIPQTADLKKGQTVITSGLGGGLPRGLLIGYIEDYQMTVDQLFQTASLKLPVDFKSLRMIWVVKS